MPIMSKVFYRKKCLKRVVNLVTFEGTSSNQKEQIHCYGFDAKGNPVFHPDDCAYKLCGVFGGTMALNPLITRSKGRKTLPMLLEISDEEARTLMTPFLGSEKVFFVKQHNLYGMVLPYNVEDKWLIRTEIPKPKYDEFNTRILKKLKSEWRIYTPKIARLLRKLEFKEVMGMEE